MLNTSAGTISIGRATFIAAYGNPARTVRLQVGGRFENVVYHPPTDASHPRLMLRKMYYLSPQAGTPVCMFKSSTAPSTSPTTGEPKASPPVSSDTPPALCSRRHQPDAIRPGPFAYHDIHA